MQPQDVIDLTLNVVDDPGAGLPENIIRLRVTDTFGATQIDTTNLRIFDNNPFPDFIADELHCDTPVIFDGAGSFHGRPDRMIVQWEWDFDYDGETFNIDATGPITEHTYNGFGLHDVALRVTDNNLPPRQGIDVQPLDLTGSNRDPLADAGGPYDVDFGSTITFDGSQSSEPDEPCGDGIVIYEWDLNGNGQFDPGLSQVFRAGANVPDFGTMVNNSADPAGGSVSGSPIQYSADGYRLPIGFVLMKLATGGNHQKKWPWGDENPFGAPVFAQLADYVLADDGPAGAAAPTKPTAATNRQANQYGLKDLIGNVAEWSEDTWSLPPENDLVVDVYGGSYLGLSVAATDVPAIPLHAMAWGTVPPASLRGDVAALSLSSLDSFSLATYPAEMEATRTALTTLYEGQDGILKAPGRAALRALDTVASVRDTAPQPAAVYPETHLGRSLADIARTIKADVGLSTATVDVGGWDLHANAGLGAQGAMADNLEDLGTSLRAFHDDLGERMGSTTLVVMSEVGRRVEENGSNGTDHGAGNCMFVLGGGIRGGAVYGDWLPLDPDNLHRGDVPVLTDYRDIVGEVTAARHGAAATAVFPDLTPAFKGLT